MRVGGTYKLRRGVGGFTLLDALAIIGVVALLLVLAVPLLYTSADSAMTSVDEANARSGYAVVSERVLSQHVRDESFVYDTKSGKVELAYEANPSPYGLSKFEARYEVGGVRVTGIADGGFLVYNVSNGVISSIRWTNTVMGTLYRHESTIYAATNVALVPEFANERLRADVDGLQVVASQYLGKTKGEIMAVLGVDPADETALANDEGVTVLAYRVVATPQDEDAQGGNQPTTTPQVRGNAEALELVGYAGATGEETPDGYKASGTRAFFSDYMNSGVESSVKVGKIEYDAEGKAIRVKAWVETTADNGTDATVPDELKGTYVKR